jgi:YD repeat-containing protein
VHDANGEVYTVRYDALNAMFTQRVPQGAQKGRCTAEQNRPAAGDYCRVGAGTEAQLKEQAAQIQKVSAEVEVTKPAPKVVANGP